MARIANVIPILIMAALSACDIGSALFTDEELDSMYEIDLSQAGSSIKTGNRVLGSTPIEVDITSMDGAPEASSLDIQLLDTEGNEASMLTFPIDGKAARMPPVTLPEGLADGYYRLNVTLYDSGKKVLSTYSPAILVFNGNLPPPRLAAYPGEVVAGSVSLLKLEGVYPKGLDPWVRWFVDGMPRSEGFVSDHADRFPWLAPVANGVYIARAELFPFKPPVGFEVPALVKAEIRLPVSISSATGDLFSGTDAWSIIPFETGFDDRGPRPHEIEPTVIGSPYLDTYATGFGYSMGAGAGVFSASSLLPIIEDSGRVAPFTAVFVLAPPPSGQKPGSGFLLLASDDKGTRNLVIGVTDGYPYLGSGGAKVSANAVLPADVSRLAVSLVPSPEGIAVTFYLDEKPVGTGTVPANLFKDLPGACWIAGENGYEAIYDELRIIQGPYPAFHISEAAAKGASLIAASGFEGGSLGRGMTTNGGFSLGEGELTLLPGSSLFIGPPGLPAAGASLSFDMLEGDVETSMKLADGSVLAVTSDGSVKLDDKPLGFELARGVRPNCFVAIETTRNGIRVYGAGEGSIQFTIGPAVDSRWQISTIGLKPAVISKVTASAFMAPLATGASDQERVADGSTDSGDSLGTRLADGNIAGSSD